MLSNLVRWLFIWEESWQWASTPSVCVYNSAREDRQKKHFFWLGNKGLPRNQRLKLVLFLIFICMCMCMRICICIYTCMYNCVYNCVYIHEEFRVAGWYPVLFLSASFSWNMYFYWTWHRLSLITETEVIYSFKI